MIENEIFCYINAFLKWNINEKASHIVGNKKFARKIPVLNLRNKRKSISAIISTETFLPFFAKNVKI